MPRYLDNRDIHEEVKALQKKLQAKIATSLNDITINTDDLTGIKTVVKVGDDSIDSHINLDGSLIKVIGTFGSVNRKFINEINTDQVSTSEKSSVFFSKDIKSSGNIFPAVHNKYTSGTTDKKWSEVWCEDLYEANASRWSGDWQKHETDDNVNRILTRNQVIPKAMADEGVVLADFTAIGKTLANATLTDLITLANDADMGVDDEDTRIAAIFPPANRALDFDISTTNFDHIQITPSDTTENAGLNITHATLHPTIILRGDGDGAGLISFDEGASTHTLMYASTATDSFNVSCDQTNGINLTSSGAGLKIHNDGDEKVTISSGTKLMIGTVDVGAKMTTNATNIATNVTAITSINSVISTDTERLDAITALTTAYTAADTTLNNTITTALTTKADIDDPTFTTKITTPVIHTSEIMSQGAHLKIGSKDTNDLNIFLDNQESLQLTRSGAEIRYQSMGGTGFHRFMNHVYVNGSVNIGSGEKYKINNVNIGKSDVGLGNVDNTSDANKPVSTAQQTALDAKADQSTTYTITHVDTIAAGLGAIDSYNSGRITVLEAADIVQDTAIALNTAKVTYDDAAQVATNVTNIALKSNIADPTFTTKITTPIIHTPEIMSQGAHLKIGSKDTNDLNIFLDDQESLQLTRSGAEIRYQSQGGSGFHRFMNNVYCNGSINIASGEKYKINNVDYLGNCDNTSDANKPVSTAQQTALDLKQNITVTKTAAALQDWSGNGVGVSVTMNVKAGTIPYKQTYNITAVTNTFSVTVTSSELTPSSVVLWGVTHADGHSNAYKWARSYHMNSGTGAMLLIIGAGSTIDQSSNEDESGRISFIIL